MTFGNSSQKGTEGDSYDKPFAFCFFTTRPNTMSAHRGGSLFSPLMILKKIHAQGCSAYTHNRTS